MRKVVAEHASRPIRIIDTCAGVGGVHQLHAQGGHDTVGVELQPAWAAAHPRTVVGDATALQFADDEFDALAVSYCYGTRMADHHQAKDPCPRCLPYRDVAPLGHTVVATVGPDHVNQLTARCRHCRGTGRSPRNTYTHALRESGIEPVGGVHDATQQQWGPAFRATHVAMVKEATRVVRPGGLGLVNISNHMRGDVEQNVAEWFLHVFISQGWYVWEVRRIATRRNGQGANRDLRVDGELLLVLHNGTPRASWA